MERLKYILERIETKKNNYLQYNFTQIENDALKTFFDLAQELGSIKDFYILCVVVPKAFFSLDARLYLVDRSINALALMATTNEAEDILYSPPPPDMKPSKYPYYTGRKTFVLTIHGKKHLIDQLPFHIEDDALGFLEVYPVDDIDSHMELFFEKYVNRIGFRMHNKLLAEKNIEHLKFIRSLVADIEHNVIVPNMVYKFFLRGLKRKITKNVEIEKLLSECILKEQCDKPEMENVLKEISDVNRGLTTELENIESHYKNMSLFIETLFRRGHFDEGRLILRTKRCNIKKDIVQPQLERYIEQFKRAGISIDDKLSGIPDEEIVNVVDVGLMAQVYANLFSNALKYTREVVIDTDEKKKYISYGYEVIKDYFGHGRDGVKYNVFSTGPHLPLEEQEKIFEEGYRGSDATNQPGTGHGLTFIKNAIEIHGGIVGYEPTQYGNNFYFILPK